MDDLASLNWGAPAPSRPPEQPGASSSYNFDALLRSMPTAGRTSPNKSSTPAKTGSTPAQASASKAPATDAFASLLPASFAGQEAKTSTAPMNAARTHAAASPAPPSPTTQPTASEGVWGLDAFESLGTRPAQPSAPLPQAPSTDASDLLDAFFAPPPPQPQSPASTAPPSRFSEESQADPPPASHTPRMRSPPPHVVGQLVAMGFAPHAARQALAQTPSGVEIEAALTWLTPEAPPNRAARPAAPTAAPTRSAPLRSACVQAEPVSADTQAPQAPRHADWQRQATDLGASVLKSANAFWGSAKAQAQKALEDARQEGDASAVEMAAGLGRHAWRRWGAAMQPPKKPANWHGKPRWMHEAEEHERRARTQSVEPGTPLEAAPLPAAPLAAEPSPREGMRPPEDTRRLAGAGRPAPRPQAAARPAPAPTAPAAPLLQRPLPREDAGALARAADLKTAGNEAFKRGAYSEAEQLYAQALEILDRMSLYRVPLLNNRANVRLKNGDSDGAEADCTANLALIVLPGMHTGSGTPVYRPAQEPPIPASFAINLREAYGKSVSQRARAYEAKEKWALAQQDWTALLAFERAEGSGMRTGEANRRAATDGATRCDKMLRPPPPKQVRMPQASAAAAQRASEAGRNRVRAHMQAQDAEETERMRHKDAVDAKLDAWQNGKKGNVRALLASVDDPQYDLVWPTLQWKKVQLHELVTDAQVKRAFTRAIAKLHPDKLKPGTTSVEQRMKATGVFHALNEAFHT